MNDTTPTSSRSLAGGFPDYDPLLRQREEGIRQWHEDNPGVFEKELDERALAAAEALKQEFIVLDSRGEAEYSDPRAIAAILHPFLQSKPKP